MRGSRICFWRPLIRLDVRPPDRLDATFAALADPTRRAILARLAKGEASVMELAEPFAMSHPARARGRREGGALAGAQPSDLGLREPQHGTTRDAHDALGVRGLSRCRGARSLE